jgi:hypothetical protein
MKVRGARRRRQAPWQRIAGSFDRFGEAVGKAVIAVRTLADTLEARKGMTPESPAETE